MGDRIFDFERVPEVLGFFYNLRRSRFHFQPEIRRFDKPVVSRVPLLMRPFKFKVEHSHKLRNQLRHFQDGNMPAQACPGSESELESHH
jgi:hypothetical protein